MLLYRILRGFNDVWALGVMWLLIFAFVIAAALMFIFPPGTLMFFWLGLIILAVSWVVSKTMRALQRHLARTRAAEGRCPICDATLIEPQDEAHLGACPEHGVNFLASGAEEQYQPQPG
jgi:hypothetical protein